MFIFTSPGPKMFMYDCKKQLLGHPRLMQCFKKTKASELKQCKAEMKKFKWMREARQVPCKPRAPWMRSPTMKGNYVRRSSLHPLLQKVFSHFGQMLKKTNKPTFTFNVQSK